MKNKFFLMTILSMGFVTCTKEKLSTESSKVSTVNSSDATTATDTIRIPLTDMGAKTYMGFTGHLYPGGDRPTGTYATDLLNIANSIVPLDASGNVNSTTGVVGFIAIGNSTCTIMMNALRRKTVGNPLTNAKLRTATCTDGGASVNQIMNTNDAYWGIVNTKLTQNNLTNKQVQVVYMEADDSLETKDFPGRPQRARDKFAVAMRTFKTKFPNIKIVYLLSRTTAFIKPKANGHIINSEPDPYYLGWACKWLIQDQINGVPGLIYKGSGAVAPIVTWGWYEWANGTTTPRKDGFVWTVDMTSDGLHATDIGADTLSNRFQKWLFADPAAKLWYAKK
jgi:hypothetical protein